MRGLQALPLLCAIADADRARKAFPGAPDAMVRASRAFASGGARWVQLRGKGLSSREFHDQAARVVEELAPRGILVVINDRTDVALASGASGVHLGQSDLPPRDARRILGEYALVGLSTHGIGDALRAVREPVDYVAIGPIFPTSSKDRPERVVGIGLLPAARGAVGLPLVAIGGIEAGNARRVLSAGAASVAAIGALFDGGDPSEATRRLVTALGSFPAAA